MENKINVYETDNLSLAPYLLMKDLKFKGIKKDNKSGNFVFIFEDDKMQGSDLAINFLKSDERKYKNYWSFFRNELAKAQTSEKLEPLRKVVVEDCDKDESYDRR